MNAASDESPGDRAAAPAVHPSRLLRRLERRIANAASRRVADALRCDRAAYLARLGDLDAARRELAAVHERQRAAANPKLTVSIALHLAEGLIAHYTDMAPAARERVARAHALASAASLRPLQALCAAWLAHFELLRKHGAAAARLAAEALALASADQHAALSRAKLVVAQAYHEAGRDERARPWYEGARRHAAAEGDEATLAALMGNMAWLRVANWRRARAEGRAGTPGAPSAETIALGAESSANLDAMLGVASLPSLRPMLRAQILVEHGRTDEALALHDAHLAAALDGGLRELEGLLLADRAWCLLQVDGRRETAFTVAEDAAACLSRPGPPGDRAPGHARLARVYDALGDPSRAAAQRAHATRSWQREADHRATLVAAFDAALHEPALA